jgi:hypothetical protein
MGDIALRGNRLTAAKGGRASLRFGGGRTNLLEQLGRVEGERSNPNRRAEISRVHGELNRGYAKGGRTGFRMGRGVPREEIKKKFEKEKVVGDRSKTKRSSLGDPKHRALYEDRSKHAEGGRTGFRSGTPKSGGAAKKRKIEQTKAVKRLTTSDKAYSPKKLIVEAFKRRGTKGAGTGTAEAITDWHNIREEAKKVQKRLPGSTVTVRPQEERVLRGGQRIAAPSPSKPKLLQPRQVDPGTKREKSAGILKGRDPGREPRGVRRKWIRATPTMAAEGGRIGLKEGTDKKWIQKATKGMVKTKPCTGKKFGSKSCPPGSRRYNLAKTFKKMGRERKAEA